MAKKLRCRDVGPDCDFEAYGATEDEIMRQVAEHARLVHGFQEVPPELAEKARGLIRDEERGAGAS